MSKKTKHPYHDDPSAFCKQFPVIREVIDGSVQTALTMVYPTGRCYKMGKILIALVEADKSHGYFMSIQGRDCYPSLNEIVWIRYNLIPDAAIMSLRLPNLNAYINYEDTNARNVFTLEQDGWAIDPPPMCLQCDEVMTLNGWQGIMADMSCPECGGCSSIDMTTRNEQHGNGLKGN